MRYKKIMMLAILLVSLLAVSAVSAADNATSDILSMEETTNEVVSVEENNQVINSFDGRNNILSANSDGTFTDLANEIAHATGELKLTKNYIYDSSKDSSYKNGITINKGITINGKGFVINGNNQARVFTVSNNDVILRNIEFINCSSSSSGGAVYWSGANGRLYDCNFINAFSSSSGGAVYWSGANGRLYDCDFINVHSSGSGGAVYWSGVNGSLFDCNYMKCYNSKSVSSSDSDSSDGSDASGYGSSSTSIYGGAVYWDGNEGSIFNCCFEDCHAFNSNSYSFSYTHHSYRDCSSHSSSYSSSYGGAVYWNKNNGKLFDCDFINCYTYSSSYNSARIINTWWDIYCSSSSSSSSSSYGGAYWQGNNGNLFNCTFINSTSSSSDSSNSKSDLFYYYYNKDHYVYSYSYSYSYCYGGAVYWNGDDGSLFNCNFITPNPNPSSSSSGSGGAIYWYGTNGNVLNSSFINCHIPNRGYANAIYWYGIDGKLFDCSFINSSSKSSSSSGYNGTVYWYGTSGNMYNCSFNGNYYDYEKYCSKAKNVIVRPVITIYTSTLNNDDRIAIFECTQLRNNVSVKLYNVTDRKILCDDFDISSKDLISYTVNNLEESEYQIVLEYGGDAFYSSTSANNLFKVGKNSSYEISINNFIDVGENVNLNLTLNEDVTGKVKLTLSNYTCINELIDGKTSFNIPYTIGEVTEYKIKYVGDDKYNPIYMNSTFIVSLKLKSEICLDLKDSYIFDENIPLNYNITPDCTGNIDIYVDDVFIDTISVGNVFELENLDAGEHYIKLIYNGDKYFTRCNDTAILTVTKANPSINVNTYNQTRDFLFEVILNEKATGNITLTLNNKKYSETLINGKANFTISSLAPGNYTGNISYMGNSNYNPSSTTVKVILNKMDTCIFASDVYLSYKSTDGELIATITDVYGSALDVNLNVRFNGENYTIKADSNGKISIPIGVLTPKTYVATISYDGDGNYNPSSATANVVVNKADTQISAPNVSVAYKDTAGELVATITNVYGKALSVYVTVNINGASYDVRANSKGKIIISTADLDVGNYTATITYNGNGNYNPTSTTATVTVEKANTTVTASDVSVSFADPKGELLATLTDACGNAIFDDVTVVLNGETFVVRANYWGEIIVSTAKLTPKKYTATITYQGNENYNPSSTTATVTVIKAESIMTAHDVSVAFKDTANSTIATLTNAYDKGLPVYVNVTLNGETFAVRANYWGEISVSTAKLTPGNYTATVSYKGNGNYYGSTATAQITVTKWVTVMKAPDTSVAYKNTTDKTFARLTDANGKGLAVYVNVTLNGEKFAVRANYWGQISFSTANLAPGTYDVTISYRGNGNYEAASATAQITVEKADTIITAPDISVAYKDGDGELVATIANAYGKALSVYVTVNLNGVSYDVRADSNGQISIPTKGLAPGTYTATITYKGNGNYNPTSTTATVTVTKADTVITAPDVTVESGDSDGKLVATLTNAYGKALSVYVAYNLNGADYTVKANSKGQIIIPTRDLAPGNYTTVITYFGNGNYNPTTTTANIAVRNKIDTAISFVYNVESKEMVATLTDINGGAIAGADLVFNLLDLDYSVTTDSKGQAKFSTTYFEPGMYTITVSYEGYGIYNPTSESVKVIIQ